MNKIREYYWAYRNKITNKFFGRARMPARGKRKGYVLFSYISEPFTVPPSRGFSNFHTMYWECYEIVKLFNDRGYDCDIINPKNKKFLPRKKYAVCFDSGSNLERWIDFLPKNCRKICPILMTNWLEYNQAEKDRLKNLAERRGVSLRPHRELPPTRSPELADFLVGFGNKTIFASYDKFRKPIIFIPISAVVKYDFPENKDWTKAKKNFLWVGGGGAVLKGLDLVLEAFKKTPDLELHVCGPIHAEKDFVAEYNEELNKTPNIHVYGRIDVSGSKFREIIALCGAVVYPSGGDGTSGAIVQAMHGGLVPLISHETGVQEDSGYIPIIEPTPGAVTEAVTRIVNMPDRELKQFSRRIWNYARNLYTRENFSKFYARFIDEKLGI